MRSGMRVSQFRPSSISSRRWSSGGEETISRSRLRHLGHMERRGLAAGTSLSLAQCLSSGCPFPSRTNGGGVLGRPPLRERLCRADGLTPRKLLCRYSRSERSHRRTRYWRETPVARGDRANQQRGWSSFCPRRPSARIGIGTVFNECLDCRSDAQEAEREGIRKGQRRLLQPVARAKEIL